MSKTTPTQRAFAKVRVDLFGIGDILAVRAGEPPLLVQATSGTNHSARVTKALAQPALPVWLLTGALFQVWSWAKRGPRGKAKVWQCRRQPLTMLDLDAAAGPPAEPAC
jgi:hypothetical protein